MPDVVNAPLESGAQVSPGLAEAGSRVGVAPTPPTLESAGAAKPSTDLAERVRYLEAEQARLIEQRDLAKKRFLESEEGKALLGKAAKAEEMLAAQAEAERKAAEQRGEFQRLYQEEVSKRQSLESQMAERERRLRADHLRSTVLAAYSSAGGIDADLFGALAEKAMADGSVNLDDAGSPQGVVDFVKRVAEAKPYLFANASQALQRVASQMPGGNPAMAQAQALQNRQPTIAPSTRKFSLAEPPPLTPEQQMRTIGHRGHLLPKG